MIVDIKIDKKGTARMSTTLQKWTFSWKTSLMGVASAVYAVAQPFIHNDTTLTALLHDQMFIMALIGAAIGFFSKDRDAHGTPEAPITPIAAAKVAAVAAEVPISAVTFVGAPLGNSGLYECLPGDPTLDGQLDPTGKFRKHIEGLTAYYVKV